MIVVLEVFVPDEEVERVLAAERRRHVALSVPAVFRIGQHVTKYAEKGVREKFAGAAVRDIPSEAVR